MHVELDAIPEEGLDVSADASAEWACAAAAMAMEAPVVELALDLHIQRLDEHLRVTGELDADAHIACHRCGRALKLELGGPVDLYYSPELADNAGQETLEAGDLDIGWFDGKGLELGQVVSEQLALWLPTRAVCEHDLLTRLEPDPGPCVVPEHDSGPDLKKRSPFAGLRLPD